ncbi:MAG: hypothetical protein AAFQ07_03680, partial [Chloroflexota bacterium]
ANLINASSALFSILSSQQASHTKSIQKYREDSYKYLLHSNSWVRGEAIKALPLLSSPEFLEQLIADRSSAWFAHIEGLNQIYLDYDESLIIDSDKETATVAILTAIALTPGSMHFTENDDTFEKYKSEIYNLLSRHGFVLRQYE